MPTVTGWVLCRQMVEMGVITGFKKGAGKFYGGAPHTHTNIAKNEYNLNIFIFRSLLIKLSLERRGHLWNKDPRQGAMIITTQKGKKCPLDTLCAPSRKYYFTLLLDKMHWKTGKSILIDTLFSYYYRSHTTGLLAINIE